MAMMRQGRSFSGYERNCAFLNTGESASSGERFANISFGSGIDFPDDARAIAAGDWDHDGDLDLWISNRNAPRLRLLRNDAASGNHFLALRLVGNGTTVNRNAIGARIEVVGGKRWIQSLRAGEGFLAQSSQWLNFGIGQDKSIQKVIVRWPDAAGTVEEFPGFSVDQRYTLTMGNGKPVRENSRTERLALGPGNVQLSASSDVARIPIVPQLYATQLSVEDPKAGTFATGQGQPVLINVWASWCAPCLKELSEFADRAADIEQSGLGIIALSVDGLGEDEGDPKSADKVIKRLKFPFANVSATQPLIDSLQKLHDTHVGLHRPLPLPTSFLIDGRGRLAVIYKGPVDVDTLLDDLQHPQLSRPERWLAAAPLGGSSIDHPSVLRTADWEAAALQYRQALKYEELGDGNTARALCLDAVGSIPEFAPAHWMLANISVRGNKFELAAKRLETLLELTPDDPACHFLLARVRAGLGNRAACLQHLRETVRLKPDHAEAHIILADLLVLEGDAAAAVKHYGKGIELAPEKSSAKNNLAWLLATHPDSDIRNGEQAVELANELANSQDEATAEVLDTMAAAQAEVGNFPAAIAAAQRAIARAKAQGAEELAAQIEIHLGFYQRGEPYRQPVE